MGEMGSVGGEIETRTQMDGQQSEVGKIGEEKESSTRSQRTRSFLVLLLNVVFFMCRELILYFLKSTYLKLISV